MAKEKTAYRCRECGATAPRWEGRCHSCGDWNTLVEEAHRPKRAQFEPSIRPIAVGDVPLASGVARLTHIDELDRVLGGGLVPGSVTLLGGEPGIGKSTLLLQVLVALAGAGNQCLLISAEESAQQVRMRVDRLGELTGHLWILSETELPSALAAIK